MNGRKPEVSDFEKKAILVTGLLFFFATFAVTFSVLYLCGVRPDNGIAASVIVSIAHYFFVTTELYRIEKAKLEND